MATTKKVWATQAQIEGAADAYTTLSGVTEELSSDVDLETNGYEGSHVRVQINWDATPTDHVDVSVYGSLDGSNWDDVPMTTIRMDKDFSDPEQLSIIVKDVAHFRIGVVQTGSTDSHDVRIYEQSWRWDTT